MGVGISLAILAFLFEWVIYYLAQKRRIKFFRNYIEAHIMYS